MKDWLTANQLAAALGIHASRVRQLVAEGSLPAPAQFGSRASLWERADLNKRRIHLGGEKGRATGQASLIRDATSPLRRTRDVIFHPMPNRDFTSHVRIWEGAADEGNRRVVVISRPLDSGYPDSFIEIIVAAIDKQYLDGHGRDAIWFEAYMNPYGPRKVFELSNLVMAYGPPSRRTFNASPFSDPIWIGRELRELTRLTGTEVEWWPPHGYTVANIMKQQRDGGMLTVEDDRFELRPAIDALDTLRKVDASTPEFETMQRLLVAVAPELDLRDRLMHLPWRDGTVAPSDTTKWPLVFAARLRPVHLPEEHQYLVRTILAGGDDPDPGLALRQARDWLRKVDKHGDEPDANMEKALVAVTRLLDPDLWIDLWIDGALPRVFQPVGRFDRQFLDEQTWVTGADIDRVRRKLHASLGVDTPVEYATLASGTQVARALGGDAFAVMWPMAGGGEITPDTTLVGDIGEGDRPVYLERNGHLVGLVNLSPHDSREWTWGRRGPSDGLAQAIVHHLIASSADRDHTLPHINAALMSARNGRELHIPVGVLMGHSPR